jgi:hypothetical protein
MMGIWFTANAIANYLVGILESLLAGSSIPLYWLLVGSSLGAGVLLLLITPLLRYLRRLNLIGSPGCHIVAGYFKRRWRCDL